ncbi:MAG: nickel pincer cofactor biosynthesis protein LarC [Lachnospiraceae bacterium]|nr:nickel pincer cofactor biosynthesis protein LarC [Lachnospiraceae bacterium]
MNESILYLECGSGISGDMTVAALLDLGADREVLVQALKSLPLSGYSIEIKDVYKSGIRACDFNVILDEEYENHDHDMKYLHENASINSIYKCNSASYDCLHNSDTHADDPNHDPHGHAHDSHDYMHDTHNHTHGSHDHTHGSHDHAHGTYDHTHDTHDHMHDAHNTHGHMHDTHGHTHSARNLQDIIRIIRAGKLNAAAADLAVRIFEIVAKAEARVHGKGINEVHFPEVGAVDSIVDIVAAAVCLDNLHPDQVVVSTLTEGCGQIRCQHGLIPVPVPAVTAIAEMENLPLRLTDIQGELVTPTGAAIAAAVRTKEKLPEQFRIRKIGLGAGKRAYATAGVLRAMFIESAIPAAKGDNNKDSEDTVQTADSVLVLETNIDDCSGEALAFTTQQLLAAGALDVFSIPIYMKKNRPAWLLETICDPESRETLEAIIFQNTTTIGIRRQVMQRTRLSRKIVTIETDWGTADIKCCNDGRTTRYFPENDSVSRLAIENKIGFPEMYHLLQTFAENHLAISAL